jgi:hypothetical protein
MLSAAAGALIILSIGILVAHALDMFRSRCAGPVRRGPVGPGPMAPVARETQFDQPSAVKGSGTKPEDFSL